METIEITKGNHNFVIYINGDYVLHPLKHGIAKELYEAFNNGQPNKEKSRWVTAIISTELWQKISQIDPNKLTAKHYNLPFVFEEWDTSGDMDDKVFYNVEWTADWGPFTKGSQWEKVFVLMGEETIKAVDQNGKITRTKFAFTPAS